MEYARKMILMPQECLQQTSASAVNNTTTKTNCETTVQTPGTPASRLDEEMCKILNSTLDEGEKCLKYEQILQRFLRLRNEEQSRILPSSSNLIHHASEGSGGDTTTSGENAESTDNHILDAVPAKFRSNARQLIRRLRDTENITWDKRGVISIDGVPIDGNIVDLVNEAMRARKRQPPQGYSQFVRILRQAGIPKEFVGNDQLWQKIINGSNTDTDVNQEITVRTGHPGSVKKRKRQKLSQDTDAEEEEGLMDVEGEEEAGKVQSQPQTSGGRIKWIRMRVRD
jgi:hypothetical protein